MRLVGKKLYRVGPLKCFKGSPPSGPSGSPSNPPPPPRPKPKPAPTLTPQQRESQEQAASLPSARPTPPPPAPRPSPPPAPRPSPPSPAPTLTPQQRESQEQAASLPSAQPQTPHQRESQEQAGGLPGAQPQTPHQRENKELTSPKPKEPSMFDKIINKFKEFFAEKDVPVPSFPELTNDITQEEYDRQINKYNREFREFLSNLSPAEYKAYATQLRNIKNSGQELTEEQNSALNEFESFENDEYDKKLEAAKADLLGEKNFFERLKVIPAGLITLAIPLMVPGIGTFISAAAIADYIGGLPKGATRKKARGVIQQALEKAFPSLKPGEVEPPTNEEVENHLQENMDQYSDPDNPALAGSPRPSSSPGSGGAPAPTPALPQAPAVPQVDPDVKQTLAPVSGDRRTRLLDRLEKRAIGRDSLAAKEVKAAQEQSLKQRLAQIKGLRGAPVAASLRSISRAQDAARREFAEKAPMATIKERKEADYLLSQMLEGDANRELQVDLKNMTMKEKEKLRNMSKQEAIDQGKFKIWLQVAREAWNLFGPDIKKFYDETDFFGEDTDISFDDEDIWDSVFLTDDGAIMTSTGQTFDPYYGTDVSSLAAGGFVSGPGSETSDSIPARLSDGEFVIKASAVRGLGKSMGAEGKEEERAKGVDFLYKLQDKMHKIEKAKIPKEEKEKLLKGLGDEPKFAEGGEAYSRPKKAFKEAIGYEAESRFHDKALKDTKFGGARRKFRHFQDGGFVDIKKPDVVKDQFKMPPSGYGSVVAAQADLMRRIEELERKMGK